MLSGARDGGSRRRWRGGRQAGPRLHRVGVSVRKREDREKGRRKFSVNI